MTLPSTHPSPISIFSCSSFKALFYHLSWQQPISRYNSHCWPLQTGMNIFCLCLLFFLPPCICWPPQYQAALCSPPKRWLEAGGQYRYLAVTERAQKVVTITSRKWRKNHSQGNNTVRASWIQSRNAIWDLTLPNSFWDKGGWRHIQSCKILLL